MSNPLLSEPWANVLVDAVGWLAMALIVTAYALVSSGRLKSVSPAYQWLNVAGGAAFVFYTWVKAAYASMALNVIWVAIGVIALLRRARHTK